MLSVTSQQPALPLDAVPDSTGAPDITQLILAWQSAAVDSIVPVAAAASAVNTASPPAYCQATAS